MTTVSGTYKIGFDDGRGAGEYDLQQGLGTHHNDLADAQADLRTTLSRDGRAYFIGWLRGYRDSVRTFNYGKWGT